MMCALSVMRHSGMRFSKQLFAQSLVTKNDLLMHTSSCLNTRFKGAVTTHTGGSQDILLQNMRVSRNSSDVLNAIDRHHTIMNSQHALQALKSLFNLQKTQNSRISNGQVINSKDFRKLCEILKCQIHHIELNELIDIVKCMAFLGVQANSKILNIVLSLISKQINDMSLQQITFLDFIIKDFKPTPVVKALKITMPIVFEANLPTKCNFDNISHITDLFSFVSKRKSMVKSSDILVEALINKREELNLKDACNIAFSLCDSKTFNADYQLLLCYVLDFITDSIDQMDYFEVESLLSRLCTRHLESNGDMSFYHEEFCNGCLQSVMNKNYSFEHTLWIMKKILKFNHVNLPFLDFIANKVEKEPWQLEQCGAAGYIVFLSAFSMADYKPKNWENIKPIVITACQGLVERTELPWLRVALDLSIVDCWNEEIMNKMMSREFLTQFMARENNKLDRLQLLVLDQVCATLSPWPVKPRAPPELIGPVTELVGTHIKTFTLQASLIQGFGGPEYIKSGVLTSLGHFLDHVVVMRKGGFPVAINLKSSENNERITTDDIQVPPDSKMVAILFVSPSMCSINNERVRGLIRITINSIEALGIAVAPVLYPVWSSLPDYERIPHLMRIIKEKVKDTEKTEAVIPV